MSEYKTTNELLENMSIGRLVVKLGVPAMFGQLFNILYSIVDRIFVGNIPQVGGLSLAGIGVCAPALTAITAFAFMVGVGGASYVSISLGRKDTKKAQDTISTAFNMLVIISIIVTALLLIFKRDILYILGSSDTLYPYAESYFTIYVSGTIAALLSIGLNQFILVQGYAKEGMISVIIGAMTNLILDPIFIYGLNMGVRGAALGTIIAQSTMTIYVFSILKSKKIPVPLVIKPTQLNIVIKILSVGFMPFLITILDNFIIIFLNMVLRKYGGDKMGDELIACATVIQSFLTIVFCPAQGITTGCGTLYGYNYGAKNYTRLNHTFMYVFIACVVYIGALEIAVQLVPQLFAKLFLQDNSLVIMSSSALRKYTLALCGVAVQYAVVDGLTAMGKVKFALPLSLFRKILYIICVFALPVFMNVEYVFYAGAISDFFGASFTIICFLLVVKPKINKELST